MNLDWVILNWIQDTLKCGWMDWLMPKITALGDVGTIWIIIGLVMVCTKKYRKNGLVLLASLLVGVLIGNLWLKYLVARSRPCWLNPEVMLVIPNPTDFSFPSGHTLSSTIAATVLWGTDRKFGIPAAILAALIAFSRIYLYVHFPSDVIVAAAIGLLIGKLMSRKFLSDSKKGGRDVDNRIE